MSSPYLDKGCLSIPGPLGHLNTLFDILKNRKKLHLWVFFELFLAFLRCMYTKSTMLNSITRDMPLLNGLLNAIQGFLSIPDTFSVYWMHLKTTKNAFLYENFDIAQYSDRMVFMSRDERDHHSSSSQGGGDMFGGGQGRSYRTVA